MVDPAEDFEDDFDVNNHPSWNNNTVQSVSRSKTLVFASENDNENIEFDFKAEIGNQYSVSFNFLYKQSNSNVVFEIIEVSSNRIIHEEKLRTPNLESDLFESIVTPVFIANSENYVIRWKKIGSEFSVVYLEDFKIKTKEIVTLNSTPDVIAYNDYYPFGMLLPNRHGSSDKYRYGYNGMEKDDELKGEGNSYDYGMRMYDPRIARWQRTDPLQYRFPHVSTYAYAFNNPVALVDVDGEYPKPSEILKGVGIENPIALGLADGFVEGLGWLDTAEMAYKLSTDAGFREQFIDGLAAIASDPIGFAASVADEYIERGKKIVGGGDEGKYELGRAIGELAGGAVSGGGALKLLKFAKKFKGSKLAKKARNKLPCGCFTEKTQIYTESGYKDIKDIQTGDIVWAYNDKTKEKQLQEVVNTFKLERDHIYKIYFANEVIEATDDHPFFIGGQWLKVKDLREGDKLTMYDGSEDAITKIEYIAGIFIVYNFEVENDHTYYVTHENVLVHNSGPCDIGQKRVGQLIENKRKGKIGEEILKAELDEIYPVGQGFKILEQASFKIKGVKGKSARPDFTIIDGEGKIVALIDAKTGNAVFTNNQVQLANNGGVLTIGKKTKDRLKKLGFVDSDGNIDIDTNVDSGEFIPETIPNSKIKAASN